MKRLTMKLSALAIMLITTVAIAIPNSVCAFGFCESCETECYQESVHVYYQCRGQGGGYAECDALEDQYYGNCMDVFCPACPRKIN